eukprot:scaffold152997_cov21-Tisochrysis_lutea.AAC.1
MQGMKRRASVAHDLSRSLRINRHTNTHTRRQRSLPPVRRCAPTAASNAALHWGVRACSTSPPQLFAAPAEEGLVADRAVPKAARLGRGREGNRGWSADRKMLSGAGVSLVVRLGAAVPWIALGLGYRLAGCV